MRKVMLLTAAVVLMSLSTAPGAVAAPGAIDPACSSGHGAGPLPVSSPLAPLPPRLRGTPVWPRTDGRMPVGLSLQPDPGTAVDFAELARFLTPEPYVRLQVAVNLLWPQADEEICLASADRDYRELVERGVRPLLLPAGLPRWMAAGRIGPACGRFNYCVTPPAEDAIDEHARLFGLLAARYPLAAGIEASNEPNLKVFFGGIDPDPELYARGMTAAYRAVKRANFQMRFLGLGLAPMPVNRPDGLADKEFLDRALAAGADASFDAVSVHPYPSAQPERYMATVDAALARAGKPLARYVVTETGVGTVPGDARQQISAANRILGQYDALLDGGSLPGAGRTDGYLVFSAHQADTPSLDLFDLNLFRPTWEPRRQACAIRQRFVGTSACPSIRRQSGSTSPRNVRPRSARR